VAPQDSPVAPLPVGLGEIRADGVNIVMRRVALLGTASVLAGVVVGGVGGRVVMRLSAIAAGSDTAGLVTENGNTVGEITVGGTVALVVFGGGLGGLLASVVVVGAEPWLQWMGMLRGLGFGLAVLAAYFSFDTLDFELIDPPALNVAMFTGLFIAFGFAISGIHWLLDRTLPPAGAGLQIGYVLLASSGLIALFTATLFFTAPGFCGCEPAHVTGITVLVMVVSTIVTLAAAATPDVPRRVAQAATLTGYTALAILVATGLDRTLDEIRRIT
jgi:hypothetical protein